MVPIILSILLIVALIFSTSVVVQKRKTGIKGVKSALSSICFFLIAITNLAAYWFDFLGIISWSISVILLLLAAYFTKYMKAVE